MDRYNSIPGYIAKEGEMFFYQSILSGISNTSFSNFSAEIARNPNSQFQIGEKCQKTISCLLSLEQDILLYIHVLYGVYRCATVLLLYSISVGLEYKGNTEGYGGQGLHTHTHRQWGDIDHEHWQLSSPPPSPHSNTACQRFIYCS